MDGEHPVESLASTGQRWRGALGHPLAILCLAGWLLNDHLWKEQFHNGLTGKLSDVFGLVVFPLLLAAVLERWIRRPMLVGATATLVLFASINLSVPANALVEGVFGFWTDENSLTPDPTDLFALPALAGAIWIWRSAVTDAGSLRKSWARLAFGMGVFASIATSYSSEAIDDSSTFVLNADRPAASLEISVRVDGAISSDLASLETNFTSLGTSSSNDTEMVTVAKKVDGEVVRYDFALAKPEFAPVQVEWRFSGELDQTPTNCFLGFFCDDPPTLDYQINAPTADRLPEPLLKWTPNYDVHNPRPRLQRWNLVLASPDAQPVLLLSSSFDDTKARALARVGDNLLTLTPGRPTPVPVPTDCTNSCEVEVLLSGSGDWRSNPSLFNAGLQLHDNMNLTTATEARTRLVRTQVGTEEPELPLITGTEEFQLNADIEQWEPGGPFEALLLTVEFLIADSVTEGAVERRNKTIMVLPTDSSRHLITSACCAAHEGTSYQNSVQITKAELISFESPNEIPTIQLTATFDN